MGQKLSGLPGSIRKTLDTVLDVTIQGLEGSKDTIVAALPVPGLSIALNVTIELLRRVQAARTNGEEIHGLCGEIATLRQTLESLAKMVQDALDEYPEGSPERKTIQEELLKDVGLAARVRRLESTLSGARDEAQELSKRSSFGRFLHSSSDAKAITNMRDNIATAHRVFQTEGGVRTETIVTEALGNIKRVIAMQIQAEKDRVLNSIPRASDAPYLSAANAAKARFQKGTRQDVLRDFKKWEEAHIREFETQAQRRTHPVCVLVGEAGTGKSTIASEFAKRLDSSSRLGASFFFNRGVSDLNSPKKFFSTIASQLAQSQSALREPVVAAAQAHLKVAPLQQLEREYHDLLESPLSTLPSSHPPIFVVVDALDECTEEGPDLVPTLLKLLLTCAVRPGCPLRILVTSRPEPHYIHRAFAIPDFQPYISTVNIQSFRDSVDRDIELLIRARLGENVRSKTWSDANPEIVPGLVSRADGLFIYARTAVDFILGDLSSLQQRYEALVPVGDKAFKLKPLDELYRIVLNGEFPEEELYHQRRETLSAVLGYLVTIQDPRGVSPNTLELLTDLPAEASVSILNALRSVVFFERDNRSCPFRILHATFREFLVEHERSGNDFYVNAKPIHRKLVVACAKIILFFKNRTRYGLAPHYDYARAHLVYHCEQISGDTDLLESPDVKSALEYLT